MPPADRSGWGRSRPSSSGRSRHTKDSLSWRDLHSLFLLVGLVTLVNGGPGSEPSHAPSVTDRPYLPRPLIDAEFFAGTAGSRGEAKDFSLAKTRRARSVLCGP